MVSLEKQETMGYARKLFLMQLGQVNREIFKELPRLHACPNRSIAYRTATTKLCLDLGISIMNYRCVRLILKANFYSFQTQNAPSKLNMLMNTAQVSLL